MYKRFENNCYSKRERSNLNNEKRVACHATPTNKCEIQIKKFKQNSAITLIALVITIIVLLILAAVTLNIVLGENGIFSKAKKAKEETEYSTALEEINLIIIQAQTEAVSQGREANLKDVIEELKKDSRYEYIINKEKLGRLSPNGYYESTESFDAEPVEKIYVIHKGYEFQIGEDLKIIEPENKVKQHSDQNNQNEGDWYTKVCVQLTTQYPFIQENNGKIMKSSNQGIQSSSSIMYIPIDLRNSSDEYIYKVKVKASISSEVGNIGDKGYATIKESDENLVTENDEDGRFMYIKGNIESTDYYSRNLIGGKIYYLYIGYTKDQGTDYGEDTLTIEDIVIEKNQSKITYLYKEGNEYTTKTGGWSYIGGTRSNENQFTKGDKYLQLESDIYSAPHISTNQKINFNNYSKIVVEGEWPKSNNGIRVYFMSDKRCEREYFLTSFENITECPVEIDISDINGEAYLGFDQWNCITKIFRIYLY